MKVLKRFGSLAEDEAAEADDKEDNVSVGGAHSQPVDNNSESFTFEEVIRKASTIMFVFKLSFSFPFLCFTLGTLFFC